MLTTDQSEAFMLGEDHSLLKEFPEYKDTIAKLINIDDTFAKDTKHYNALDKEIRELELQDSPIGDGSMIQLKHNRAELKDALHLRLIASN